MSNLGNISAKITYYFWFILLEMSLIGSLLKWNRYTFLSGIFTNYENNFYFTYCTNY